MGMMMMAMMVMMRILMIMVMVMMITILLSVVHPLLRAALLAAEDDRTLLPDLFEKGPVVAEDEQAAE